MAYTHNWNHQFIQNTSQVPKKSINFCLEIGSFEGLTSNYIVENLLSENGKLFCVDPLTNVYLNENLTETDIKNNETIYKYFNNQYDRFLENTKNNSGKINLIRKPSSEAYPELLEKFKESFDLIYIDGDHRASAVYLDAVNCFELCKKGGIILFDDYSWGKEIYSSEATSYGIDKFTQEYDDKIQITLKDYQLAIYKK
jgi:predicted O-methyltransferase YrrM